MRSRELSTDGTNTIHQGTLHCPTAAIDNIKMREHEPSLSCLFFIIIVLGSRDALVQKAKY
jgi:hypothetical protein